MPFERRSPAVKYEKGPFGTLRLVLRCTGSVYPRAIPWGILAAAYSAVVHIYIDDLPNDPLFDHPYPYQGILVFSGFVLVFRLNQSLVRYWEARTAAQIMGSKWSDAVLMALAFDEVADKPEIKATSQSFGRCLIHLASLAHGVAMHALRGDPNLDTILARPSYGQERVKQERKVQVFVHQIHQKRRRASLFNAQELRKRDYCYLNPIPVIGGLADMERLLIESSPQPVHLVLGWLHRLLVTRKKAGGIAHDPPIVSRVYQVLSDGSLGFCQALKIVDTPFPLPYAQLNAFVCYVNLVCFPIVVADKVVSLAMCIAVSFFAITIMFGLNEVARDLEDPFTTELGLWMAANRIYTPQLQAEFDERLLAVNPMIEWPDVRRGEDDDHLYASFLASAVGTTRSIKHGTETQAAHERVSRTTFAASQPTQFVEASVAGVHTADV